MILLSNEITLGNCVIINHIEQPCAKLLAVIISFDEETVTTNYLNADKVFNSYNKKGCVNRRNEVTPVSLFGVQVVVDLEMNEYWCDPVGETTAKYHDGELRLWQEHGVKRYKFRPKILKIATKAMKLKDAGWKFGTVSEFLQLTDEDERQIALKLTAINDM
jgi:hypothetical protein